MQKTGGPEGPPAILHAGRRLFLAAEDAAEGTAEDAAQATRAGLLLLGRAAESAAEDAAEEAAAATLQGHEDVVQVHVTVAVLVLDDALEAAEDLRDEGEEACAESAQFEFGEDVVREQVARQLRDRAGVRIGLAGKEVLDDVDTAGSGRGLGQGTKDGIGQAAKDLLLHVGRDLEIAASHVLGHLLEDDVAKVHSVLELVFRVFVPTNIMKKQKHCPQNPKKRFATGREAGSMPPTSCPILFPLGLVPEHGYRRPPGREWQGWLYFKY